MAVKKGTLSIDSENIFPIIKKWVYSDHDIFVRELISNGCDAVTKLKKLDMMGEYELPEDYKAKIEVIVNPEEKTMKFIDNGLGMTAEEVEEYITQIAFSGATQFLEKYKDKTTEDDMIGHFGLGFYSAFMVADEVQIDTLSYKEGASAVHWASQGGTEYEMQEGNKETVGTEIAALADVIWHEHFTPIIGKEQVEYMLSRFQSYPALQDQVLTGYEYYRLLGNRKLCGYMAIRQDQDGRMFLSKLYIAKQYRGRHLAAFLFDFLKNLCRQRNCSAIWLTCNKHNDHSLNVYRHFGFQTIDAQKNDIGNGFFMDDYIMEYRL